MKIYEWLVSISLILLVVISIYEKDIFEAIAWLLGAIYFTRYLHLEKELEDKDK